jgi:hypothetical protein
MEYWSVRAQGHGVPFPRRHGSSDGPDDPRCVRIMKLKEVDTIADVKCAG